MDFSDNKSEMGIIGCMLESNIISKRILSELTENHFNGLNRFLFKLCGKSYERAGKCSKHFIENTIEQNLSGDKKEKLLRSIKSAYALSNKNDINIYIDSVKLLHYKKLCSQLGEEIAKKSRSSEYEKEDLDELFFKFKQIRFNENTDKNYFTSKEIKESEDELESLTTNNRVFNEIIYKHGGLEKGTLESVCMISGHGKTFYSMKKGAALAMAGHRGAIFYLEDKKIRASKRIDALIDPDKYPEENANFMVVSRRRRLDQIISDILTLVYNEGIEWVILDHMGKTRHRDLYNRTDVEREVSSALSDVAVDEGLNITQNIQTPKSSRYGKNGWQKAPDIEALKGAGEIVEDSVVVTVGFRPNNIPELIVNENFNEEKFVKNPKGEYVNYNSVFIRQVKNRRIMPSALEWIPMIQDGKELLWVSEAKKRGIGYTKNEIVNLF